MPVTDPIADMLTRIRNATAVKHEVVMVHCSKLKLSISQIFKQEGFIQGYDVLQGQPQAMLRLHLAYREKGEPAITGLKKVSKSGLRVYVGKGEISRVYGGLGIAVLSTSQGIMTGQEAWRRKIGGELLCYVW